LMVAAVALSLLVASGIALAVNKVGTQGRDFLKGTDGADNLVGKGGNDRIFSLAGEDNLIGGPGKDWIFGGRISSSQSTVGVDYTFSGARIT
jgi:Ca2+-binding RTX toxin-like protein